MPLMPVAEALRQVLAGAEPLTTETVALDDAFGRVLATDIAARRTQPPADVSAMDGYAVRAEDTASEPSSLTIIGEVAAGHPFEGKVGTGEAARIFTGGVVPDGADCVIVQEVTEREGNRVVVKRSGLKGKNIRRKGIDFREGEALLARGRRLDDRDLMLAASMNHAQVAVHRRPKVAIIGTGDELVMPGAEPRPGEIVYSNGFALTALARAEGAEARDFGIARDTLEVLGHEQQSRCPVCGLRFSYHQFDQLVKDAMIMIVDLPVSPDYLTRGVGVLGGECVKRILQHLRCNISHQRKIDIAVYLRLVIEHDRRLGDARRMIGDAF